MLTINLEPLEYFNSKTQLFEYEEGGIVRFEYTLKVLYEWEAKWRKPFLKGEHTEEELMDLYLMMAIDPIDPRFITSSLTKRLADYISDTNTATTFTDHQGGQNGNISSKRAKVYTSEEIYALMFSSQIPLEFENRNLNRLLVILKIIASYNSEPKKMSKEDIMKQNSALNAQRRAKMKTRG